MEYANYARYLEESLGYSDATLDTLSKVWRIESIKTLLKMLAMRPELTVKEPFGYRFQCLQLYDVSLNSPLVLIVLELLSPNCEFPIFGKIPVQFT